MTNASPEVTAREIAKIEDALAGLDSWTDEQLVGQLFSVAIGRHSATGITADAEASSHSASDSVISLITSHHLGGVCYFPTDLAGDHPRDIAALTAAAQHAAAVPLLISTDQENGTVSRLKQGFTRLPSAMALAATRCPRLWTAAGRISSQELITVGINHAFAPVADLNTEPKNPVIGVRSPGADVDAASMQLGAVLTGMSDFAVASTLKHFPGHGTTTVDSHLGLPHLTMSVAEWEAQERETFRKGIEAGADCVMIGHLVFDAVDDQQPATFSRKVITGQLRESLGFQGVIVTDALEMSGANHDGGAGAGCVAALAAGVDQLLMPGEPKKAIEYTVAALRNGELDREELLSSARRILALKLKLARGAARKTQPELSDLLSEDHRGLAQEMADLSVIWRDANVTWSATGLESQDHVLVIGSEQDPIGRGVDVAGLIAQDFVARNQCVTHREFGAADLVEIAENSMAIVLVTRDGWRDSVQIQDLQAVLKIAQQNHKQLCVIASRNPSDSGLVPAEVPMLLMLGDLAPAANSAIRILHGELEPTGSLPVALLDVQGNIGWPARLGKLRD